MHVSPHHASHAAVKPEHSCGVAAQVTCSVAGPQLGDGAGAPPQSAVSPHFVELVHQVSPQQLRPAGQSAASLQGMHVAGAFSPYSAQVVAQKPI